MAMTIKDIVKLDAKELKTVLENELTNLGYNVVNEDGYLYAEGTYPVMLVAHMDTVHHDNCTVICESEDGNYLMSPQGIGGDDRCGIYMVLKTLEEIPCSVVFTEEEEIGCIGAGKFAKSGHKPAALNYIVEYDRKGKNDAVFYSCDNPDFTAFVTDEEIGFKEEHGSCSDISKIAPALGVAAVNISSGYYNQHTIGEYINIRQMEKNIERGKKLIQKPSEKFEYMEKKYIRSGKTSGYYGGYYNNYYNNSWWDDDYYSNSKSVSKITDKSSKDDYTDLDEINLLDPPTPDFEIEAYLNFGLGIPVEPARHYILINDEKYCPKNLDEYYMDEEGRVYALDENSTYYYPLVDSVKVFFQSDDTPVIYEHMDEEEFVWGYKANLDRIEEYIEELEDFDLENGTDFTSEFYEEIMNVTSYISY